MSNLLAQDALLPATDLSVGRLAQGGTHLISLSLDADRDYEIVAVCDGACSNLDLLLYNSLEEEVADDRFPDDIPMLSVSTRAPGAFELEIVMTRCSTAVCAWGVRTFSKRR